MPLNDPDRYVTIDPGFTVRSNVDRFTFRDNDPSSPTYRLDITADGTQALVSIQTLREQLETFWHRAAADELTWRQAETLRLRNEELMQTRSGLSEGDREALERENQRIQAQAAEAERAWVPRQERQNRRALVNEKAMETLRRMLSPTQRETLERARYFDLTGSEGNQYQIFTYDFSGNIYWIVDGERKANFCCHPEFDVVDLEGMRDRLPVGDAFIAQKLMLEADELGFLRTTVINAGDFPPQARVHTENLPLGQRCHCDGCVLERRRAFTW